jgi:hypothetical protein
LLGRQGDHRQVVIVSLSPTSRIRGSPAEAWSASFLVIGAISFGLAAVLSPTPTGGDAAPVLAVSLAPGDRAISMAVALCLGSVGLLMGIPALSAPFAERARRLGGVAIVVYSLGVLGGTGYAAVLVILRMLVEHDALRPDELGRVMEDDGLVMALGGWVGCFYVGAFLLGVALIRARRTSAWVPILLLSMVALLPFVSMIGHAGQLLQVLLFVVALTGIATASIHSDTRP